MPDGLAAFLAERLNEEEAAAKAVLDAAKLFPAVPQRATPSGHQAFDGSGIVTMHGHTVVLPSDVAAHIALHDPARTLRAIAAKRAILGMHHPTSPHPEFGFTYPAAAKFCGWCGPGDNWQAEQEPDMFPFALWPCTHVRHLGSEWADHPAYLPEWSPQPTTAP